MLETGNFAAGFAEICSIVSVVPEEQRRLWSMRFSCNFSNWTPG